MKLLILSDVHRAWDKLSLAIRSGNAENCEVLLFAGDAESPDVYRILEEFNGEIHTVWGNNDIPHFEFNLYRMVHPQITHHGHEMNMLFDGVRIFMHHYPENAEEAARTGKFDVCIHGHTHRTRNELCKETTILNPGEICGTRFGTATYVLFDTETRTAALKTIG